jgi:predicted phage tail protein
MTDKIFQGAILVLLATLVVTLFLKVLSEGITFEVVIVGEMLFIGGIIWVIANKIKNRKPLPK